jgi:hypothetical protein
VFLGELQLRSPSPARLAAIERGVKALVERQEKSGGWAHGPGGKNALNYLELNIVGGYAICAMSLARQCGVDVDDAPVKKAMAYFEAAGGEDGAVGYAAEPGQMSLGNIGRNALCWMGAKGLGLSGEPWTRKMGEWTAAHVADFLRGHATLLMHISLGGVAAAAIGGATEESYWKEMAAEMEMSRSPDGGFQPRPWHESINMRSNQDVSGGEGWCTAMWALVLTAPDYGVVGGGLPGWCAKNVAGATTSE